MVSLKEIVASRCIFPIFIYFVASCKAGKLWNFLAYWFRWNVNWQELATYKGYIIALWYTSLELVAVCWLRTTVNLSFPLRDRFFVGRNTSTYFYNQTRGSFVRLRMKPKYSCFGANFFPRHLAAAQTESVLTFNKYIYKKKKKRNTFCL